MLLILSDWYKQIIGYFSPKAGHHLILPVPFLIILTLASIIIFPESLTFLTPCQRVLSSGLELCLGSHHNICFLGDLLSNETGDSTLTHVAHLNITLICTSSWLGSPLRFSSCIPCTDIVPFPCDAEISKKNHSVVPQAFTVHPHFALQKALILSSK